MPGFFQKSRKRGKSWRGLTKFWLCTILGAGRRLGALIRKGGVTVNGSPVKKADEKIDPEKDEIRVLGEPVTLAASCGADDEQAGRRALRLARSEAETVVDLLEPELYRRGLFPAGRLDKDTEGLLILTDDGDLAHRMLAPKSHVYKLYQARLDKPATREDAALFAQGLHAGELECLPRGADFGRRSV